MIITAHARGPSYSTDQTARALHASLAPASATIYGEPAEPACVPRERAAFDLQGLYPELFIDDEPSRTMAVVWALGHAFATWRHAPAAAKL
ncbi:MAG: hypothetical protein NVSMB21_20330 [Vulcanimicrobiaceae bacterium]